MKENVEKLKFSKMIIVQYSKMNFCTYAFNQKENARSKLKQLKNNQDSKKIK
jgi:hypothetical protein